MPKTTFVELEPQESPEISQDDYCRTIWECTLFVPGGVDQEFLFRSSEDFRQASLDAHELVAKSPSCKMVAAEIINLKRIALLWN